MSTLQALPLRDYQRQALDSLSFTEDIRRLAIVLPTGAGKTVCFAHDAKEWLDQHPEDRVLVLVDLDELVWQTVKEMAGVAPHLGVGVVKASRNEVDPPVIVASVQSLSDERLALINGVTRVIVDECEAAVAPTYMRIMTHFGCFRPDGAVAVGYTATLIRGDGKSLFPVWQQVAFTRDLSWMIRHRYLIPPRGLAVEVPDLDLRKVKGKADYRDDELGEALAESLAPELVAKAVVEHAGDRRGILFAPTVASAAVFAGALEEAGVSARVVHGGIPLEDRRAILRDHKAGKFRILCNCMILTKGYNDPGVSLVVMARPTKSRRLYIQCIGRGLRVDPALDYDGQDCMILDVVGANAIHDLRTIVDLSDRKINPDEAHSGRTLVELEDDLWDGGGVPDEDEALYRGPVQTREFDPMGRPSTKVWIRTAGGTYFMPAGRDAYVFIMEYPEPGVWSVAQCPKSAGKPSMTEHRGLPLDQALVWAEDLALELGADLNTMSKSAPWRRKVASDKMASLARALGLTVQGETIDGGLFKVTERAGVLSDRMTEVMGTRRLDPIVKAVRR